MTSGEKLRERAICLKIDEIMIKTPTEITGEISTGEFRFPNRLAAEIAVRVVRQFLDTKQSTLQTVVFNVFKDEDYRIYQQLLNA